MITAWLIEHNNYHRWLRGIVETHPTLSPTTKLVWDDQAIVALWFGREEDARAFIYLHKDFCVDCRPTEHQFGV